MANVNEEIIEESKLYSKILDLFSENGQNYIDRLSKITDNRDMNNMRIDNIVNPKSFTQATTFLQFSKIVDSQGGGLLFCYGY